MAPSSSGPGRQVLILVTPVRLRLGPQKNSPKGEFLSVCVYSSAVVVAADAGESAGKTAEAFSFISSPGGSWEI